ncbi:hypothetical protein CGRA01v4_04831 [Colletotrichum graminicola]|nr:hypothetical protein CGRA01v4_04831 [Colletotrichum graminicola]
MPLTSCHWSVLQRQVALCVFHIVINSHFV